MDHFRQFLSIRQHPSGSQTILANIRLAIRLNGTEVQAKVLFDHDGQTYRWVAYAWLKLKYMSANHSCFFFLYSGPVNAVTDHHLDS